MLYLSFLKFSRPRFYSLLSGPKGSVLRVVITYFDGKSATSPDASPSPLVLELKRYTYMKICEICKRSFPKDIMISFSPGGARRLYECPECHDRACNHIEIRQFQRRMQVRAAAGK